MDKDISRKMNRCCSDRFQFIHHLYDLWCPLSGNAPKRLRHPNLLSFPTWCLFWEVQLLRNPNIIHAKFTRGQNMRFYVTVLSRVRFQCKSVAIGGAESTFQSRAGSNTNLRTTTLMSSSRSGVTLIIPLPCNFLRGTLRCWGLVSQGTRSESLDLD